MSCGTCFLIEPVSYKAVRIVWAGPYHTRQPILYEPARIARIQPIQGSPYCMSQPVSYKAVHIVLYEPARIIQGSPDIVRAPARIIQGSPYIVWASPYHTRQSILYEPAVHIVWASYKAVHIVRASPYHTRQSILYEPARIIQGSPYCTSQPVSYKAVHIVRASPYHNYGSLMATSYAPFFLQRPTHGALVLKLYKVEFRNEQCDSWDVISITTIANPPPPSPNKLFVPQKPYPLTVHSLAQVRLGKENQEKTNY